MSHQEKTFSGETGSRSLARSHSKAPQLKLLFPEQIYQISTLLLHIGLQMSSDQQDQGNTNNLEWFEKMLNDLDNLEAAQQQPTVSTHVAFKESIP